MSENGAGIVGLLNASMRTSSSYIRELEWCYMVCILVIQQRDRMITNMLECEVCGGYGKYLSYEEGGEVDELITHEIARWEELYEVDCKCRTDAEEAAEKCS